MRICLNNLQPYGSPGILGVYLEQLLGGTLYPVDGVGILIYERERGLGGDNP